jgi:class 3 adenylate cyclase
MIAELRNFTRMSEMLDADRVLALVDRFFELAAGAALKFRVLRGATLIAAGAFQLDISRPR